MVISERARHDLFLRLEAVLGAEEAATLMEHLPPVGWADVATKRDLDQLAVATKREFEQMDERWGLRLEATEHRIVATMREELGRGQEEHHRDISAVRSEIGAARSEIAMQTRLMVFSVVSSVLGAVAISFAAGHL